MCMIQKPISVRARRIMKTNGVRAGKVLDYRHRIRNYGPSVYCWDDRTWSVMTHSTKARARAEAGRVDMDEALSIIYDALLADAVPRAAQYTEDAAYWEFVRWAQDTDMESWAYMHDLL